MSDPFQTHGAISWSELVTPDVEAAKAFYAELFGWDLDTAPMEGTDYTVVKVAGKAVGGMMKTPPNMPPGVPPHWGLYITVEDVQATVAKIQELGGSVWVPPTDIPKVGTFAVVADPQGAVFSVIRYAMRQ